MVSVTAGGRRRSCQRGQCQARSQIFPSGKSRFQVKRGRQGMVSVTAGQRVWGWSQLQQDNECGRHPTKVGGQEGEAAGRVEEDRGRHRCRSTSATSCRSGLWPAYSCCQATTSARFPSAPVGWSTTPSTTPSTILKSLPTAFLTGIVESHISSTNTADTIVATGTPAETKVTLTLVMSSPWA